MREGDIKASVETLEVRLPGARTTCWEKLQALCKMSLSERPHAQQPAGWQARNTHALGRPRPSAPWDVVFHHCILWAKIFLLYFLQLLTAEFALNPQSDFGLLSEAGTNKTLSSLKDGLGAFQAVKWACSFGIGTGCWVLMLNIYHSMLK